MNDNRGSGLLQPKHTKKITELYDVHRKILKKTPVLINGKILFKSYNQVCDWMSSGSILGKISVIRLTDLSFMGKQNYNERDVIVKTVERGAAQEKRKRKRKRKTKRKVSWFWLG